MCVLSSLQVGLTLSSIEATWSYILEDVTYKGEISPIQAMRLRTQPKQKRAQGHKDKSCWIMHIKNPRPIPVKSVHQITPEDALSQHPLNDIHLDTLDESGP